MGSVSLPESESLRELGDSELDEDRSLRSASDPSDNSSLLDLDMLCLDLDSVVKDLQKT